MRAILKRESTDTRSEMPWSDHRARRKASW